MKLLCDGRLNLGIVQAPPYRAANGLRHSEFAITYVRPCLLVRVRPLAFCSLHSAFQLGFPVCIISLPLENLTLCSLQPP